MIYFLHGENEFEKRQRLTSLLEGATDIERLEGEELTAGDLRNLFQGQTLFSDVRTVVVSSLSEGEAWSSLPDIATESDTMVILLEGKVDKRTKTYRWLQKNAKTEEFAPWSERDSGRAVDWCTQRAKQFHGFELLRKFAQTLVDRLGCDQLRLDGVLAQLSLADEVSEKLIDAMVPLAKSESAFELFEAALAGSREEVHRIIAYLESESGPDGAYQTLGLLVSQLVVLNALVLGDSQTDVAKDFSAHPFVVRKLTAHSRNISVEQLRQMNSALGQADLSMKTTSVTPWLLLEAALMKIMQ